MEEKFVVTRILGNDLPPRHYKKQTLLNLQFILENEPDFQNCKKTYILNRIIDKEVEKEIIDLLELKKQEFIHIPFHLDEYDVSWDSVKKMQKIIELNKARNIAIEEGLKNASWVFH